MLTHADVGRFERRSADGDVAAVRRPFFDWLERRSPEPVVREELLDLITSVVDELAVPSPIGFTLTAEDGGENVLVRFLMDEGDDDRATRVGRGVGVADRLSDRMSVDVVPTSGDGYVLLDVLLPATS